MTQLRAPLTFADAMTRVAGVIGWPECCRIAGRADRTVRHWSHPDTRTVPPIDQALAFDAAYREAGGDGSPFFDAYVFQLDIRIERQEACPRQLIAEVGVVSLEMGQAVAACLALSRSNASPLDAHRAFAETQEAAERVDTLLRRLASFLPAGAGPAAGNIGVES